MDDTRLIALDWGSSSLRAYRVGADGRPLERLALPKGILHVTDGDFDRVFTELLAPWRGSRAQVPVIACGMIGSRQGWVEAPYIPCPAGRDQLANSLTRVPTRDGGTLWIIPGVSIDDPDDMPDVVRGEEAQLVGAGGDGLVLLPGTHSKWAWLEQGRIAWFSTFMTGEVFATLSEHSILGRLMTPDAPPDDDAFARGLERARVMGPASGNLATGGLLRQLFSVRTLGLFERLGPAALPSYFSGLLIGTEIVEATAYTRARMGDCPKQVRVIGGDRLSARYALAMRGAGFDVETLGEQATVTGIVRIAEAAGLV